jgi:hypothetical protein
MLRRTWDANLAVDLRVVARACRNPTRSLLWTARGEVIRPADRLPRGGVVGVVGRGDRGQFSRSHAAMRSASMIVDRLVLAAGIVGMIEASATSSRSVPYTWP